MKNTKGMHQNLNYNYDEQHNILVIMLPNAILQQSNSVPQVVVVMPQTNGDNRIPNLTPSDLFQSEVPRRGTINGLYKAPKTNNVINSIEPSVDSGLLDGSVDTNTKLGSIMNLLKKDQAGD